MRRAIHAVYYDDRKADLIRDCLLPEAKRLAASDGVQNVYLQRHWIRGPHVQLRIRAEAVWYADGGLRNPCARIESYMYSHPSRAVVDPDGYLARSRSLGRLELVPPPYEPLWPDNTVVVGDYDSRHAPLGGEAAVRFKEDMLALARAPLSVTLDAIHRRESSRLEHVLRLLALTACTYPDGGLVRGQLSYRSHVEDFLFDHDDDGQLRRTFQSRSNAVAAVADGIIGELVNDVTHDRYVGSDQVLQAWWPIIRHGWQTGVELIAEGVIKNNSEQSGVAALFDTGAKWASPDDRPYGPFHTKLRKLQKSPFSPSFASTSFPAYRWIVNMLYSCLPLLDVSPIERYCLAFIIAEAAERHYGVTWEMLLDDLLVGNVPDVIRQIRRRES